MLGSALRPLLSRDGGPKVGFFTEATLNNTSLGMTLILVVICDSPNRHWRSDEGGGR